eukprot:1747388-Amphidinium_carterae.1
MHTTSLAIRQLLSKYSMLKKDGERLDKVTRAPTRRGLEVPAKENAAADHTRMVRRGTILLTSLWTPGRENSGSGVMTTRWPPWGRWCKHL